jgi:MraZ protein
LLDYSGAEWDVVGPWGGSTVFSGRFDHSIDEKGRVSIPARFREILQRENHDRLYITNFPYDGERCLALYPPSQWDKLNAQLQNMPRFDPQVQAFETMFIGGAHEVPVDRQGRILIPTNLRDYARLDREVTFSARRDHFQLWDKQILGKVLKATEEKITDPEFFTKLGL